MKLTLRIQYGTNSTADLCGPSPSTILVRQNGNIIWSVQQNPPVTNQAHTVDVPVDVKIGDEFKMYTNRGCGASNWVNAIHILQTGEGKSVGAVFYGCVSAGCGSPNTGFGFKVTRLLRGGTPTYLETLDKMDQWSSAQYDPEKSRNKLNL